MTAIVIPACDIKEHNKTDLEALLECIKPDANRYSAVVVCFDGCEIEFVDYFTQKFGFIHSFHNRKNKLGFSRNSNIGLRFVRDVIKDDCFLINQDCLIPSFDYMSCIPGEGLSTPITTEGSLLIKYLNPTRTRLNDKFAFYCPHFSLGLLNDVGVLDEDLKNLFSDDSYVLRTLLHGKYPIESVDIKIHHKGSHISTEQGWESGSGTYNQTDLSLGLVQYTLKWDMLGVKHENIIKEALKRHKWKEEMRIM
jgi:hypothetical protein